MDPKTRPIVLIHGLWNTSDIFKSLMRKLDRYSIDYFAPTLQHDFGKVSIIDLTKSLNDLINNKYGFDREIDFSIKQREKTGRKL